VREENESWWNRQGHFEAERLPDRVKPGDLPVVQPTSSNSWHSSRLWEIGDTVGVLEGGEIRGANSWFKMRFFDESDVIHLLQAEVKRTGGSNGMGEKKTGVNRSMLNKILSGRLSPTKKIIGLLNLRLVYVSKKTSCHIQSSPLTAQG
jgi:hypothetical protein